MALDRLESKITYGLSVCMWLMAFALTVVVILRYGFGIGATALGELSLYALVAICMLGMAPAYEQERQVRLDIFYGTFSSNLKNWINVIGNAVFKKGL